MGARPLARAPRQEVLGPCESGHMITQATALNEVSGSPPWLTMHTSVYSNN